MEASLVKLLVLLRGPPPQSLNNVAVEMSSGCPCFYGCLVALLLLLSALYLHSKYSLNIAPQIFKLFPRVSLINIGHAFSLPVSIFTCCPRGNLNIWSHQAKLYLLFFPPSYSGNNISSPVERLLELALPSLYCLDLYLILIFSCWDYVWQQSCSGSPCMRLKPSYSWLDSWYRILIFFFSC